MCLIIDILGGRSRRNVEKEKALSPPGDSWDANQGSIFPDSIQKHPDKVIAHRPLVYRWSVSDFWEIN